jgi:Nucleotidyltransferase of unknown function (DUF6036)
MPPDSLDASYFSPDILEFIALLDKFKVRYVVVGGEAVIYYGHARLTGDIDFFYDIAPENTLALFAVLKEFWNDNIPGLESVEELRESGVIIQFGRPPNRIDLLNQIDGVTFEEAWRTRVTLLIKAVEGGIALHFLGLENLIQNKTASARPRDLEDLRFLRRISP